MEKKILFEEQRPQTSSPKDMELIRHKVGSFGNAIKLSWPTDFLVVTQVFGINPELHVERGFPSHEGLDIRAPVDSKVYACADGTVETIHRRLDDGNPYGRYVTLLHNDGYRTLYAHLGSVTVSKGQKVKGGSVIGAAGVTGITTGGHIHLSLSLQGATAKGLTHFPDDLVDPTPFLAFSTKARHVSSYPWPIARCLAGVRAKGGTLEIHTSANYVPNAALLRMDATKEEIAQLRKNNTNLFLMTQLVLPVTKKPIAAAEWAAWVQPSLKRHVDAGIGYFSVLGSPNLTTNGFGQHWVSGKEFGRWWMQATDLLKASFPTSKFGFPGLAPGPQITGQRFDSDIFMEEADEALLRADWIGALCSWNNPKEMLDEDKGAFYRRLRNYYPDQLIFITEFGSVNRSIDQTARASEAARYYEEIKDQAGIGAAFFRG